MANNSTSVVESLSPGNNILDDVAASIWQNNAILVMQRYVFLIIFIFGWINNCLSILVLQTKAYRGTSTGFLMTVLACADIGVVCTSAGHIWVTSLADFDVRLYSPMGCAWHIFFTYLFIHMSAWSLTLITMERVVCVYKPFRVKELLSLRKTVIATAIVMLILIGFDQNLLWTSDLYYEEAAGMVICSAAPKYIENNYWIIWNPINTILASFGPFGIILPCNVVIITYLVRRASWMKNSSSKDGKISSTTVMLTVNSIAFVLLTAPAAIELVLLENGSIDPTKPTAIFLLYFFHVLFNINSCINFFLYAASSNKFRRALMSLFGKKRKNTLESTKLTSISQTASTNGKDENPSSQKISTISNKE